MKNRYEKIKNIYAQEIAMECPVLLQRGAILKEHNSGNYFLQLKLSNADKKVLQRVYLKILCCDDSGGNIKTVDIAYTNLSCEEGACFGSKILTLIPELSESFHITEINIIYSDGTNKNFVKNDFEKLPPIRLLKEIIPEKFHGYIDKEDNLKCQPEKLSESISRCACGGLIKIKDKCPNCGKTLQQVTESASLESISRLSMEQENNEVQNCKKSNKKSVEYLPFWASGFLLISLILSFWPFGYEDVGISHCITLLLMSALLLRKKGGFLICAVGTSILYDLFYMVYYYIYLKIAIYYPFNFGIHLMYIISYLLLLCLIICKQKATSLKRTAFLQKTHMIPGLILLIRLVIIVSNNITSYIHFPTNIIFELPSVFLVLSIFITSYWIAYDE